MTTFSRVLAWALVVVLAGGLIVLAIAGVPAAAAVLVTAAAVVVMVVMGGALGGRHGTSRAPAPSAGPGEQGTAGADDRETGAPGGTMSG